MPVNVKPSQVYPNVGSIPPQSLATAAATTGATYLQVPAGSKWIYLRLLVGAGAGSVAITAAQATAAAGTGTKAMTLNPTVTGILTAATVTTYEFSVDTHLDIVNGFSFVQFTATTTGTLIVGLDVSFGPAQYMA
jgi:hypothetical protein